MTEFSEFEESVRGQPLRAPSADLDRRVAAVFDETPPTPRRAGRRVWKAVAALATTAVAAYVVLHVASRPPPQQSQWVAIEPDVKIEQIWSAVIDSKVIAEEGRPAAEQKQRQIVRHVRWVDDRNQVEIEWNIPSEQSAVVPLEYN